MTEPDTGMACDKAPTPCKDGDNKHTVTPTTKAEGTNPILPTWARLSINRCNLPAVILGSLSFQASPSPLYLDGVRELHRDFFRMLDQSDEAAERLQLFYNYMSLCFRLDALEDAGLSADTPKHRGKLNYLKLIRGWHFNSDSVEGAVLKAWVESRFGLLPRHHRAPIRDFSGEPYRLYLEQRATGLYNTNALEAQLDLVYTFTQRELACEQPQQSHFQLYRGINRWEAHERLGEREGKVLVLLNNVNSFSTDAERASEFGDRVIVTAVPREKIICSASVFPGKLQGEGEALVIGGLYAVGRV